MPTRSNRKSVLNDTKKKVSIHLLITASIFLQASTTKIPFWPARNLAAKKHSFSPNLLLIGPIHLGTFINFCKHEFPLYRVLFTEKLYDNREGIEGNTLNTNTYIQRIRKHAQYCNHNTQTIHTQYCNHSLIQPKCNCKLASP
jgi:hypothetical protein